MAAALEKRRTSMPKHGQAERRQVERIRSELAALFTERATSAFSKELATSKEFSRTVDLVSKKKIDPDTASRQLFRKLWKR